MSLWDRLSLAYRSAEHDPEAELPLRLLLLDDFSGHGQPGAAPVAVGPEGLDPLLRERRIRLPLTLPDHLNLEAGRELRLEFEPQSLADFAPAGLLQRLPPLREAMALLAALRALKSGLNEHAEVELGAVSARFAPGLLASLELQGPRANLDALDYAVAELGLRLAAQLDTVLHHPRLQALEAAWRGAQLAFEQLREDSGCELVLLDLAKDALAEDFESNPAPRDAQLYSLLYSEEFGQFGGRPFAAVICGYGFEPVEPDLALLRRIGEVTALAHCPFVAAAGPAFFGAGSFEELSGMAHLEELHRGPRFARWRGFTEESASRYIALTLPRVLLRSPYEGMAGGALAYREDVSARQTDCLWGSAAYAFAGCLLRSFAEYRVCVDIVGPEGGAVTGLPQPHPGVLPTEVLISEGKEAELSGMGFMPLSAARAEGRLAFYAANSVHWRHVSELMPTEGGERLGLRLGAQLPYLFLISRIAHYLKVIQRDTIGAAKSAGELQTELNAWLRRYVADVDNPEAAVRARRPLRRAELTVEEPETAEGWYRMRLAVVPHVKYLGQDYKLAVEGRLGQG